MRITKKEIRQMVPEEDYERGLAYYEQDRVISYREEVTKDLAKLTCKVRGTKLYTVNASFSDRGLSALCTCPRFADRHCCKHLVAALLTMVSYQPETNRSDGRVSRILKAYRDRCGRHPSGPAGSPDFSVGNESGLPHAHLPGGL